VKFKGNKAEQSTKCLSETDERAKISDICAKDMPEKVEVFRCHKIVQREERWTESPYAPNLEAPA
jgi:hypothetical protein